MRQMTIETRQSRAPAVLGLLCAALILVLSACQGDRVDGGTPRSSGMAAYRDDGSTAPPAQSPSDLVVLEAKDGAELLKLQEQLGQPSPEASRSLAGVPPMKKSLEVHTAELPRTGKALQGTAGRELPDAEDPEARARTAAAASANRIQQAQQGELWAKPVIRAEGDPQPAVAFPLKHTAVKGSISGYVASTTVSQTYANPFETAIEAVYVFPLPADSAVNGFTMKIGERVILGLIRARAEAKEIYERAKSHGYTASLLEQERPNIFTQSVANIAPKQEVVVDINYVNLLRKNRGVYEYAFPMVVGPRYLGNTPDADRINPPAVPEGMRNGHDISLELEVDAGLPIERAESPTHKVSVTRASGHQVTVKLDRADNIPNRDFVLRLDVRGAEVKTGLVAHADGKNGYVSLLFTPPANPAAVDLSPREITFLVDISGSMNGTPLELSRAIMNRALDRMRPHDTFNIFFFAGGNGQLWELPRPNTPENVGEAKAFLARLRAGGGTEMLAGLQRLFAAPRANNALRMVVFFTDGYVGNESQILAAVKANTEQSRFFIFGVGSSVNRYLIDGIGKHGRGHAEVVLPREHGQNDILIENFFSRIDAPCLTDISVDWGGLAVSEAYPQSVPDVFAGHPVSLVARYDASKGAQIATIKVRGRKAGAPVEYSIVVDLPGNDDSNPAIASVWARQKIESLMDARLGAAKQDYDQLTRQIVDVALAHKLVSEGTSFVAVDESQRIGDGKPTRVDVPVEHPEDVDRKFTR